MRLELVIATLLVFAAPASAQDTKAPATKQGTKAPATKQDTKAAATSPATKQETKTTGTKQDTKTTGTKAPGTAGQPRGLTVAPEAAPAVKVPEILRESYDYDAAGRRDPFFSLMGSADLRPTVTDLKLSSILYHPTRPIAIMRDITTNTQYRVTLGSTLGRMRVVMIRPRAVIFTIEEFGLNRQDSLILGDTTKVRAR